jgi:hypothetical protein
MSTSASDNKHLPSRKRLTIYVSLALVVIALVGGAVGIYSYINSRSSPIPSSIQSQLTFSPFVMTDSAKGYSTSDYKLSNPVDTIHILSFKIHVKDGPTISLSEYPQPSEFTDIPEYQNSFLTNIAKQYDSVQTTNGTIFLGRLNQKENAQLGVMIERGLLVFLSPETDLSPQDWRKLGDQLSLVIQ